MPTENELYTIYLDGWAVRVKRPPVGGASRVAVLIHGWTGDENSMWVFARNLPSDGWILAPRGPAPAPAGGFGWVTPGERETANYSDYAQSATRLTKALDRWLAYFKLNPSSIDLMGFSMGAAMVFTLLAENPARFGRVAGLAGFLPAGAEQVLKPDRLMGKNVFIAHGSQDETVPVEKARQAAALLQAVGARVTYCEDNVGHKLGASCHRGLDAFFNPA